MFVVVFGAHRAEFVQARAQAPGARRQPHLAGHAAQAEARAEGIAQQVQARRRRAPTATRVRARPRMRGSWPSVASWRASAPSMRSILLKTSSCGMSPAPISASTASTCAMRSSRSGSAASITCSSRSASRASARVERNAATSSCGRSRTKPTVSASTTRAAAAASMRRTVGIERGEQLVGGVRVGAGERVEQRRLAGVGVADQRDARQFAAHARAAHLRALHFDLLQARAAAASTRFCSRRRSVSSCVSPGPRRPIEPPRWRSRWVQPRTRRVAMCLQLREFDLQLAFVAARALREDVEDQAGAVDHAALERLLEVAFLARASADG